MSFAGGKMSFSKGYLGGSKETKEAPAPEVDDSEEPAGDAQGKIHAHLQEMHQMTGHGHSHIEHKPEGHMAHHIDHEGNISGPEEHGDCPGGMCGGGM